MFSQVSVFRWGSWEQSVAAPLFFQNFITRCADFASCEHMCCKRGLQGVEGGEDESLEKLRTRGDAADDAGDWKTAITAYGRAVYLYVDYESWRRFYGATQEVEYSMEERRSWSSRLKVVTWRRCF